MYQSKTSVMFFLEFIKFVFVTTLKKNNDDEIGTQYLYCLIQNFIFNPLIYIFHSLMIMILTKDCLVNYFPIFYTKAMLIIGKFKLYSLINNINRT